MDLLELSRYQFDLPKSLIANKPVYPRDSSRLLVVNRKTGEIREETFRDILELLEKGDSIVTNNAKVIPARLFGTKISGGKVEFLLLKSLENGVWEALAKPAKKISVGACVYFSDSFSCKVVEERGEGVRVLKFNYLSSFWEELEKCGQMPLPHYIQRDGESFCDKNDYQTIYASVPGSVAAPTAGLHFTQGLLEQLESKGVSRTNVTLHVGLGTFRPVQQSCILNHVMHSERCVISKESADILNALDPSKRQVLVGTTCCRALETAATNDGKVHAGEYCTNLFIYPGYQFKIAKTLLTNFHLPGSTLLMLVCAFAGYELTMEAYYKAIEKKFRFFSYGDAMLIL